MRLIAHSRDGDLRNTDTPSQADSLHDFSLAGSRKGYEAGYEEFQIPLRFDLGVGGNGIIGRRISFYQESSPPSRLFWQGIIGWN